MFGIISLILIGMVNISFNIINYGKAEPTSDEPDDNFEPNDYYSSATLIYEGTYFDLQCLNVDWYKIYLNSSESLTVTIIFSHYKGDLDLELYHNYNPYTTYLNNSNSSTNDESATLNSVSESGYYYIKIYGWENDTNAYDMYISIEINKPPSISIISHKDDDTISGLISVTGTVSDPNGLDDILKVVIGIAWESKISNDIKNINKTIYPKSTDWTVILDTTSAPNGKGYLFAFVFDNYGNDGSQFIDIIISNNKKINKNNDIDYENIGFDYPSINLVDFEFDIGIASGTFSIDVSTFNINVEPGESISIEINAQPAQSDILISYGLDTFPVEFDTPIGKFSFPITSLVFLDIHGELKGEIIVNGPGIVYPSTIYWSDWGTETINLQTDSDAEIGDEIKITVILVYSVSIGCSIDYSIGSEELFKEELGDLNGSIPVSLTANVKEKEDINFSLLSNVYLILFISISVIIIIGIIFMLRKKKKNLNKNLIQEGSITYQQPQQTLYQNKSSEIAPDIKVIKEKTSTPITNGLINLSDIQWDNVHNLEKIFNINEERALNLFKSGYTNLNDFKSVTIEDIMTIEGINPTIAKRIIRKRNIQKQNLIESKSNKDELIKKRKKYSPRKLYLMRKNELQDIAKDMKLKKSGTKAEIIQRILKAQKDKNSHDSNLMKRK